MTYSMTGTKKMASLKRLMACHCFPLDNWISNISTDTIYEKHQNTCTDSFPCKKTSHYHKYEWQYNKFWKSL